MPFLPDLNSIQNGIVVVPFLLDISSNEYILLPPYTHKCKTYKFDIKNSL